MIGGIVTRDPITSAHERTLSADNARSQPITPVWRTNFEMDRFFSICWWGNLGKLLRKQCQTSTKKSTCFVLFSRRCFRCERKYLKDNKGNKLLLASEICAHSCPWTLSVPRTTIRAYFLAQSSLLFIYTWHSISVFEFLNPNSNPKPDSILFLYSYIDILRSMRNSFWSSIGNMVQHWSNLGIDFKTPVSLIALHK